MSAIILSGREIAAEVHAEVEAAARSLRARGIVPCLSVVMVGENPASQTYVRSKIRTAAALGIDSRDHFLPEETSEAELLALIDSLNRDAAVHGILVQLPLPHHLDARRVLARLAPEKDVDGLHPFNLGELLRGPIAMPPCTPQGIMELLARANVPLEGCEAVVVGRSLLVGKPVAQLLMHENATVTQCHSRTRDLPAVCRRADLLVVAIGRARQVTGDYIKPGAVVIDVGINREDGRLVGDVDFETARHVASAITPVPGGVGPLTVAMLMRNTITAARLQSGVPTE